MHNYTVISMFLVGVGKWYSQFYDAHKNGTVRIGVNDENG